MGVYHIKYLKLIDVLFFSFGVELAVINERKGISRMWENAYLSIKNPKASRAPKLALDPGYKWLSLLMALRFTMSATFGLRSWPNPGSAPEHTNGMVKLYLTNIYTWRDAAMLVTFNLIGKIPLTVHANLQGGKFTSRHRSKYILLIAPCLLLLAETYLLPNETFINFLDSIVTCN